MVKKNDRSPVGFIFIFSFSKTRHRALIFSTDFVLRLTVLSLEGRSHPILLYPDPIILFVFSSNSSVLRSYFIFSSISRYFFFPCFSVPIFMSSAISLSVLYC